MMPPTELLSQPAVRSYWIQLAFAVTAVWVLTACVALALRRSTAAVRHRVWALGMLAALMLPAVVPVMPQWRLGIVPAPATAPAPARAAANGPNAAISPAASPATGSSAPTASAESLVPALPPPVFPRAKVRTERDRPVIHVPQPGLVAARARPLAGATSRVLWLAFVWLSIATALLGRQVWGLVIARRLVRRATAVDQAALDDLDALAARAGVNAPAVRQSGDIRTPMCVGLWRSCILLPPDWHQWTRQKRLAVLTHELAHAVRRDVAWQTLARLACAAYWPHPLGWIAAWRMRVERELACDDWVLRAGEPATQYARWLLDLAAVMRGSRMAAAPAGVAMAAGRNLEGRVAAILDLRRRRSPVSRRSSAILAVAAATVLVVAASLSPLSRSRAAETKADQPAATQPAAAPGATLADGIVVDEGGKPAAGALVEASVADQPVSTRTGDDGRFSLHVANRFQAPVAFRASAADGQRLAFFSAFGRPQERKTRDVRLVLKPARKLDVTVRDSAGHPVSDATVIADSDFSRAADARSDAAGHATLAVPADLPLQYVLALKNGVGLDYAAFWRTGEAHTNPYRLDQDFRGPVQLVLNGARTITVRVVDDAGQPLRGVFVYPWYFQKPNHGDMLNVSGLDLLNRPTDADGRVTFDMIPADNDRGVMFWTRLESYFAPERCIWKPDSGQTSLEAKMLRLVRLTGRALDEAGHPVAGATVRASGDDFGVDRFDGKAETATDGMFEMQVNPDMFYLFRAGKGSLVSAKVTAMIRKGVSPPPIELTLVPGIRVHGVMSVGPAHSPVPNASVSLVEMDSQAYYKLPKDQQLPSGTVNHKAIDPVLFENRQADAQGRFEFSAGPGDYYLDCFIGGMRVIERFTLSNEKEREVNLHGDHAGDARPVFTGRVVLKSNPAHGVPDAVLDSQSISFDGMTEPEGVADRDGRFTLFAPRFDTYLHAKSPDGKLQGIVLMKPADKIVTVAVEPTASASGRILGDEGKPVAGATITYGYRINSKDGTFSYRFGGTVRTDANGAFALTGLVPGYEYTLNLVAGTDEHGMPNRWRTLGTAKPVGAQPMDLGDLKPPPEPHVNTPADFARQAFAQPGTAQERFAHARRSARLGFSNVLVVLGSADRAACRQLWELRYSADDEASADALAAYTMLPIDIAPAEPGTRAWADQLKLDWPQAGMTLAVFDPSGKLLAQSSGAALSTGGTIDSKKLVSFLNRYMPVYPDAEVLYADAMAKARREGKRVLFDESAAGCGWCIKLGEYFEDNRSLIEKDFVPLTIDWRFPHAKEVIGRFHANRGGTPWMAIADPDGRIVITSDGPAGNIGYPGEPAEQRWWERMLRAGAKRLTDADIHQLIERLKPSP